MQQAISGPDVLRPRSVQQDLPRCFQPAYANTFRSATAHLVRTAIAASCMHESRLLGPAKHMHDRTSKVSLQHYSWCLKSSSHSRTGTLIRCNQLASLRCSSRMSMWWSVLPRELERQESWSSLYYALCRGEIVFYPTPRNRTYLLLPRLKFYPLFFCKYKPVPIIHKFVRIRNVVSYIYSHISAAC